MRTQLWVIAVAGLFSGGALLVDPAGAQTAPNSGEAAQRLFDLWDINSDDRIEGGELVDGLNGLWSERGPLGPDEFEAGWKRTLPMTDTPDFAGADTDGNGTLSDEELRAAFAGADLQGPWQVAEDGYLTTEEFAALHYLIAAGEVPATIGSTTHSPVPAPDVAPEVTEKPACQEPPYEADCPRE